jgi:hypothetical protein
MSLTFRSSISEMVQIVVRDADGSKRVATLERDPSTHKWAGSVDHPSGEKWSVNTFDPDAVAALGKLSQAFVAREVDFRASKGRGHRPEARPRDLNVRVDEFGQNIAAPIRGYER